MESRKIGNEYNFKDMKIILESREDMLTWTQSPNLRNDESLQVWGQSEAGKSRVNKLLLMNNIKRGICRRDFHFIYKLHLKSIGACSTLC